MLRNPLLAIFWLFISLTAIAQNNSGIAVNKVVIDPGHGGKDPGAVSLNTKHYEKHITLAVSKMLGKLIKDAYPNVSVIYTRDGDQFIPLDTRSQIANREKADLFISIHVNSARAKSASGTETFVMGPDKSNSNLEVTKLENSVIVLEGDDYTAKYEGFDPNVPESYIIFSLLQNAHLEQSLLFASLVQEHLANGPIKANRGVKQAGLLVLWKTTMPSVLVELGFISNSNDLAQLIKRENQEKMAKAIFNAFSNYKRVYEGEPVKLVSPAVPAISAVAATPATTTPDGQFTIQILAVTRKLSPNAPDLKGLKEYSYKVVGNYFKYHTGSFKTREEATKALQNIKQKFPQAFITKLADYED